MTLKPMFSLAILLVFSGTLFAAWAIGLNGSCTCNTCNDCMIAIASANCTHINVTSNMNTAGSCIYDPAAFDNKVLNCMGNTITGPGGTGGTYGIYLDAEHGGTIANCTITGFRHGIWVRGSTGTTIRNVISHHNYQQNIFVYISPRTTVEHSTVYNAVSFYGIYLYRSNNSIVRNNRGYDTFHGINIWQSDHCIVANNRMSDNHAYNYYIRTLTNATVINNSALHLNPLNESREHFRIQDVTESRFFNNTANDSYQRFGGFGGGFILFTVHNNTFSDNFLMNNTPHGFYVSGSSDNTFRRNQVYAGDDGGHGFFFTSSSNNNTVEGGVVAGHPGAGILASDSHNLHVLNARLRNNFLDVNVSTNAIRKFSLSGVIFGDRSFVNLSLVDRMGASTGYSIDYGSSTSPALPGYRLFSWKVINITPTLGASSIDSIIWHWLDWEAIAAYNESRFELWKYSGSWALLNNSPDTTANTLSLYNMNPASDYALYEAPSVCVCDSCASCENAISNVSCSIILLNTSIGSTPNCINFAASNKVFDCQGHSITGTGSNTGIWLSGRSGNVIKNCHIIDYSTGIYLQGSSSNNLTNNTLSSHSFGIQLDSSNSNNLFNNNASNNLDGIYLSRSSGNILSNNTVSENSNSGIALAGSSLSNRLTNVSANRNNRGFYIVFSSGNTFTNITAEHNAYRGIDIESSSTFNTFSDITSYNNTNGGVNLRDSSFNTFRGGSISENGGYDFHIRAANDGHCNNRLINVMGSGGRQILYYNSTVVLAGIQPSELVLCNADNSVIVGVTINGSDRIGNNGLLLARTDNAWVGFSSSSRNYVGFSAEDSTNILFLNNTAHNGNDSGFYTSNSNRVTFINNSANGNLRFGFEVPNGLNFFFADNTAYSNVLNGLYSGASNSVLRRNAAAYNGQFGIMVEGQGSINLSSNTVHDNWRGLLVVEAENAILEGTILYNNSIDFISAFSNITATELLFLNPQGEFVDFTNLSISDISAPGDRYGISWSTSPAAPPPATSFRNKFVIIASGPRSAPVLDNVTWHWTELEAAASGLDESTLDIYKYNGTVWVGMGATLDADANALNILGLSLSSTYVIAGDVLDDGEPEPDCAWDDDCEECFYCSAGDCVPDPSCVPPKCETNEDCPADEECVDGECLPIGCTCGYIESHACIGYECCDDSDCPSGYECKGNECEKEEEEEPEPEPEPESPAEVVEPEPEPEPEPPIAPVVQTEVPKVESPAQPVTEEQVEFMDEWLWLIVLIIVLLAGIIYALIDKRRRAKKAAKGEA